MAMERCETNVTERGVHQAALAVGRGAPQRQQASRSVSPMFSRTNLSKNSSFDMVHVQNISNVQTLLEMS